MAKREEDEVIFSQKCLVVVNNCRHLQKFLVKSSRLLLFKIIRVFFRRGLSSNCDRVIEKIDKHMD